MKTIPIFSPVYDDLQRVEQKMRETSQVEYEYLAKALDYLLGRGGKRLRPALALLSTKFHNTALKKAVALAAAVEMLHTATLVHDDLIDNSLLRRGGPTLNAVWSSEATILTGDYLFARAASLAAETGSVRVMSIFAETLMTICGGELKQILGGDWQQQTREDYYQRIYSKTASLFVLSTEAGAVLSGAPEPQVQALRAYGRNLGMAFQIIDDVLDFTGDEHKLGKPVGNDLRQGVLTLPTLYFLEEHPADEMVITIFNEPEKSEEKVQAVVAMIRGSRAVESSVAEAKEFALKSQETLRILPANEYRQALLDLADYVIERKS